MQRFDYSYNLVGNRTEMIRDATIKDVYSHQPDDQLSGVSYDVPVGGGAAASAASFSYDAVGNRTSVEQNGSVSAYTSNVLNQYTAVGGTPFGYNGNGNLTGYTPPPGFTTSGVAWTYSYDAQNRLLSAAGGANAVLITYDSRNRQVSRTINGVVTYFIWDAWNLIEERSASGALAQSYTHGAGVDELICKTNVSGTVYYHHDGLGNVTALSDAAGVIVEKCRYDVFGSVTITNAMNIPLAASAYGNRFLFTGREWIAEAGLYDYRNRVYAAEIGRFLQNDPIRFLAGDVNLYRYVANLPLDFKDPEGKWIAVVLAVAAVAVIAAGVGYAINKLSEAANAASTYGEANRNFAENYDGSQRIPDTAGGADSASLQKTLDSSAAAATSMPNTFGSGPVSLPGETAGAQAASNASTIVDTAAGAMGASDPQKPGGCGGK